MGLKGYVVAAVAALAVIAVVGGFGLLDPSRSGPSRAADVTLVCHQAVADKLGDPGSVVFHDETVNRDGDTYNSNGKVDFADSSGLKETINFSCRTTAPQGSIVGIPVVLVSR